MCKVEAQNVKKYLLKIIKICRTIGKFLEISSDRILIHGTM